MRLLQVTPTFFSDASVVGGGERYVGNVCAAALAAADAGELRCDILSFGTERATLPMQPGSDMHIIPGAPADICSFAGEEVDRLIDAYDVIHLHQCLLPFAMFLAARARIAGKVVIGTDHGGGETHHLERYRLLGGLFDAFHAQSEFAATSFSQFSTPVHVIRGPVDDQQFVLSRGPRQSHVFVSVGRFLPHKGYEHAIAALPAGATLVIVGRPHDEDYFQYLRKAAAGRDVRCETSLDDSGVLKALRTAGLYIHSGTHFGFRGEFFAKPELLSLAPLEAMCTGTPAVVSRAGALSELVSLEGCRDFADAGELASLLDAAARGSLFTLTRDEVRAEVVARYGTLQFGRAYLHMLRGLQSGRRAT